jgi:hypothetical protein
MLIRPEVMRKLGMPAAVACLVCLSSLLPAGAYNYSNNLTYSLPFLQSSGGFLPFVGSGFLPGFSSGYLPFGLRNSLYRPYNYVPNNQPPSAQQSSSYAGNAGNGKPMVQEQYADPEPLGDPRQRVRAYRLEKGVHDQVAYAHKRGPNTPSVQGIPPTAPEHSHPQSAPALGGTTGQFSSDSANFIDAVNTRFNGDISKALFDPATRASAKSMGLIDEDGIFDADFSPARVDTIRGILRDPNLDSQSKLGAIKFLLPAHSSK